MSGLANRCLPMIVLAFATAPAAPADVPTPQTVEEVEVKFTISRETTYVTGPVNPDGTINYVAYINRKYSKGVTPANNAAIPLLQAIGPDMLVAPVRARTFEMLGMAPLPQEGKYFLMFKRYIEKHSAENPGSAKPRELLTKAAGSPWSEKDYLLVAGWLKANRRPLDLIAAAGKRARFHIPAVSEGEPQDLLAVRIPDYSWARDAGRALAARAMLRANGGDFEGARADLMAASRLARRMSQDWSLVGRVVGLGVEAIAVETQKNLATGGKLPAKQARALLADLARLRRLPDIREALSNERFSGLDAIMLLARNGANLTKLIAFSRIEGEGTAEDRPHWAETFFRKHPPDWNEVLRTYNRWFDEIVEMIPARRTHALTRTPEQADQALKALGDRFRKAVENHGSPEAWLASLRRPGDTPAEYRKRLGRELGNILVVLLMPSLRRAPVLQDRCIAKADVAHVAMALAACKAETGKFPDKLPDLTPRYLKTVPPDVFSGKALIYRRQGKGHVLYSVGENRKDDGGVNSREDGLDVPEGEAEKNDLVARVSP